METARLQRLGDGALAQRCSHFRPMPVLHRWKGTFKASHSPAAVAQQEAATASGQPDDEGPSGSGRITEYVRPEKKTFASPSITSTGTLRPPPLWFPAWMKYRRREENYVFWQDKFSRNSMDIAYEERRWTVFSTIWYLVMQTYFRAIPPALKYVAYLIWYPLAQKVYEAHKALVLWQCQLDAYLAARAVGAPATPPLPFLRKAAASSSDSSSEGSSSEGSSSGAGKGSAQSAAAQEQPEAEGTDAEATAESTGRGAGPEAPAAPGFSRTMAIRRLHWKNTLLAEILYMINITKTGRVHMLPPKKRPPQRPTLFWLF